MMTLAIAIVSIFGLTETASAHVKWFCAYGVAGQPVGLANVLCPDFFVRAAGAAEFGLSFALVWTPLCRRASAPILAGMFLSAVLEFGKIDAIGHSCIVALVLAIAADDRVEPVRMRQIVWTPVGYAASLAVILLGYCELHSVLFGTTLT